MHEDPDLARFAEQLIRLVRDPAIYESDQLAAGRMRGRRGEVWRQLTADANIARAISQAIPDVVDQVLFQLLDAIDDGELDLCWTRTDGTVVSLQELGKREMAGWLAAGARGWPGRFSTERYSDYLSDVDLGTDQT